MPAQSFAVRRAAFAAFVQRVTDHAEQTRGLSIPRIAKLAGINDATIYRWRDGSGSRVPTPESVVAFCDALDIPPAAAFAILWPGKNDGVPEPEPLPADPALTLLQRRLNDPKVSEAEKVTIRATIAHLAGQPAQRAAS